MVFGRKEKIGKTSNSIHLYRAKIKKSLVCWERKLFLSTKKNIILKSDWLIKRSFRYFYLIDDWIKSYYKLRFQHLYYYNLPKDWFCMFHWSLVRYWCRLKMSCFVCTLPRSKDHASRWLELNLFAPNY